MVRLISLYLFPLVLAVAQQPSATSRLATGAITGMLQGDDGKGIKDGLLILHLTSEVLSDPKGRREWTVSSSPSGTFRFDRLPTGRFTLCAHVADQDWINPCEWGLASPIITLTTTAPEAMMTMVLSSGAVVHIRVDDTNHDRENNEGKVPGAHVLLGVTRPDNSFRLASVVSEDSNGKNQRILIPFDIPVQLIVFSAAFQLTDANGIPMSQTAATRASLVVPRGQKPPTIHLAVSGIHK